MSHWAGTQPATQTRCCQGESNCLDQPKDIAGRCDTRQPNEISLGASAAKRPLSCCLQTPPIGVHGLAPCQLLLFLAASSLMGTGSGGGLRTRCVPRFTSAHPRIAPHCSARGLLYWLSLSLFSRIFPFLTSTPTPFTGLWVDLTSCPRNG